MPGQSNALSRVPKCPYPGVAAFERVQGERTLIAWTREQAETASGAYGDSLLAGKRHVGALSDFAGYISRLPQEDQSPKHH